MASRFGVLYTGVTNDLTRRVWEHKHGTPGDFTNPYSVNRLVYFEQSGDPAAAIARRKQIKAWARKKKVALIRSSNPDLHDLSEGWSGTPQRGFLAAEAPLASLGAPQRRLGMTGKTRGLSE